MSEIAVRPTNEVAQYATDPTGGRLVAWAQAASAAHALATSLCRTSFVPKIFQGNPAEATAVILLGDELGLSPLSSLQSIYSTSGRPALYARTMVALVMSRGHLVWTEKTSDAEVVVCGQRAGTDHVERSSWTPARARKAGYTSNKKYESDPQGMLFSKASAEIARKIAPDVLAGVPYSVEDLELESSAEVEPPKPTRVQRAPKAAQQPDPEAEPAFDPPVTDEPAAGVSEGVELITEPQMKIMQALFTEKGFKDRGDRLGYVTDIVGIEVESSKDLTKGQASRVIDGLQNLE